jgi:hypothetical protein
VFSNAGNKTAVTAVPLNVKTFRVQQLWFSAGALVSLVTLCSVAVHPFGVAKQFDPHNTSVDGLRLPPEVAQLVKRSCMDCHSNQTVWPWYSYVAPMSWFVERDVRRGRDRMNLSEWEQYAFKQKQKLLADIASAVKNGEMPLAQYTLVHREARLSDADRDIVYNWARAERRKMRAAASNTARPLPSLTLKASGEAPPNR